MKQLPWICIVAAFLLFAYVEYRELKGRIETLQNRVEGVLGKADESITKTRSILERVDAFVESLKKNRFFQEEMKK